MYTRLWTRPDIDKLRAILALLGEEYFSPEEVDDIKALSASDDWADWRAIRDDV